MSTDNLGVDLQPIQLVTTESVSIGSPDNRSQLDVLEKEATASQDMTCCDRCKALTHPIYFSSAPIIGTKDRATHLVLIPEAFRISFYISFLVLILIGYIVTKAFGNIDEKDNPVLNTFGTNNLCIYFDVPPFTYFGAFLYIPVLLIILTYETLDMFRVYDSYRDDELLNKCEYSIYCIATGYEIICFCWFLQIFATQPTESLVIHTIPYWMVTFALWTLTFKHALFFIKTKVIEQTWLRIITWIYVMVLLVSVVIRITIGAATMWTHQLWKKEKWKWTNNVADVNGNVLDFLILLVPIFWYFAHIHKIDKIDILINRRRNCTVTG